MKRKTKIFISSAVTLTLAVFIIYNILYFNYLKKDLNSSSFDKKNFESIYIPKIKFEDRPVTKINNVSLNILNETNITKVPMLLKSQRYYIPLNFICNKLKYIIDNHSTFTLLHNAYSKILLTENYYTKNSKSGLLRGNLISSDGIYYISISDIEELFDLIAMFDFENNSISLLSSNIETTKDSLVVDSDKVALIRLEDFSCGDSYSSDKNQLKVKCIADFLYSQGIKFHISWIPRFKSPKDNIDNDLLTNNNITNVGFVNLLDKLINRGGEIGLHGYTHQYGDEKSAYGEELSKDLNNTDSKTKAVIENGLNTANALNITISYFETPHYTATQLQRNVIEDYFQFIYEPFDISKNNIYKSDNYNLFVPTPLGYVNNLDTSYIIDGLNNYNPKVLHSFFYHPFLELEYINFNINNNMLNVAFDENSPLQQIVKVLKANQYKTVHINELIDK